MTTAQPQDTQDVLSSLKVSQVPGRTHLFLLVKSKTGSGQTRQVIRCYQGSPYTNSYPYDQQTDSYLMEGVTHIGLGHVPVCFAIQQQGSSDWNQPVPMPMNVVERYLSDVQKTQLQKYRDSYPEPNFAIEVIQMTGCEI